MVSLVVLVVYGSNFEVVKAVLRHLVIGETSAAVDSWTAVHIISCKIITWDVKDKKVEGTIVYYEIYHS